MNSFRLVIFLIFILFLIITYQRATIRSQSSPQIKIVQQKVTSIPTKRFESESFDKKVRTIVDDFTYPTATVTSSSSSTLTLTTPDDTSNVSEWYKEKIKEKEYRSRTFTQSNTNGVVVNKLSGVSSDKQIQITIERNVSNEATEVTIIFN